MSLPNEPAVVPEPSQVPAIMDDIESLLYMYEQMYKIRQFEEQVNEFYKTARMPGLAHLYSGEEAVAVGVCQALSRTDYITSTHRGHGHCLAKGASVDRMFAELLGKKAGYCKGKGGSMHIADPETGNLGANAIVGAGSAIATGAALSAKMRGSDQVSVCFFGEGALGQGLIYEAMNMASLWKLPIIYVCENNLYAEYTFYKEVTAGTIAGRPAAFDIPFEEVNGQDAYQVYCAALRMVERARRGEGPSFLMCNTYRYYGHHVGDINRAYYRPKEEEMEWRTSRDPIMLFGQWLKNTHGVDDATLTEIEKQVSQEVNAGAEFALKAPYPAQDEVYEDVYAD